MNIAQHLATKIKKLSKEQKKPVSKMLIDCGLNKNFVYYLDNNGTMPAIDSVVKIAEYLNVSVDYLLSETDDSISFAGNFVFAGPAVQNCVVLRLDGKNAMVSYTREQVKQFMEFAEKYNLNKFTDDPNSFTDDNEGK